MSLSGAQINCSLLTTLGLAQKYKAIFSEVNGFHGVSKAICLEAAKYGADLNKCRVVYSGFNLDQFPIGNWQNDFKSLSKRPVKIISVGRTHWKKGYHYALDAIAMLKKEGVSFNYLIIGAAGSEELLFQRNQLDLENEVSILNNVPFNEVKQLISAADIMLLSSLEEGIANVIIEAMLLGTLVITTDCGGMIETVTYGQTGWVVPVRKPEAIAQAVIEIKSTSANTIEKIIMAARQKAEEQYIEERMASEMITLYNSILLNYK